MINVVIADDHHLVRSGTRALLEKAEGIKVIGEAANGLEAVELVERLSPHVLVTDIAMPRLNGIQAVNQVRTLELPTQVIILSMHSNENLVRQALKAGAKGYLMKDSLSEELPLAILAVSRGATYLSPAIADEVITTVLAPVVVETETFDLIDQLTDREREVLQLIGEGHTNNTIGETLNISVKTVERHRSKLMAKLGVNNLVGLIRAAIKHGLIILDE